MHNPGQVQISLPNYEDDYDNIRNYLTQKTSMSNLTKNDPTTFTHKKSQNFTKTDIQNFLNKNYKFYDKINFCKFSVKNCDIFTFDDRVKDFEHLTDNYKRMSLDRKYKLHERLFDEKEFVIDVSRDLVAENRIGIGYFGDVYKVRKRFSYAKRVNVNNNENAELERDASCFIIKTTPRFNHQNLTNSLINKSQNHANFQNSHGKYCASFINESKIFTISLQKSFTLSEIIARAKMINEHAIFPNYFYEYLVLVVLHLGQAEVRDKEEKEHFLSKTKQFYMPTSLVNLILTQENLIYEHSGWHNIEQGWGYSWSVDSDENKILKAQGRTAESAGCNMSLFSCCVRDLAVICLEVMHLDVKSSLPIFESFGTETESSENFTYAGNSVLFNPKTVKAIPKFQEKFFSARLKKFIKKSTKISHLYMEGCDREIKIRDALQAFGNEEVVREQSSTLKTLPNVTKNLSIRKHTDDITRFIYLLCYGDYTYPQDTELEKARFFKEVIMPYVYHSGPDGNKKIKNNGQR